MLSYFKGSILFTIIALALGGWLGWHYTGSLEGVLATIWICAVLAILEVSISFDNAAVNATVLRHMDPVWQQRFLTWGIVIAVFGMRIIFPLLIVAIAAHLGPVEALQLALNEPDKYAEILKGAHVGLMGFAGTFLGMVGLKYFFDSEKEVDWIAAIEGPLKRVANIEAIEIGILLLAIYFTSRFVPQEEVTTFLVASLFGLVTFIGVEVVGHILEAPQEVTGAAAKTGLGAFLYLEVLDASFSFDGVIGAFALSTNLFVIAVGLGIGAMFVRSFTIFFVRRGTMSEYRYLEHGAFYAILALAGIMFVSTFYHVTEVVTGAIGAVLIGIAFVSSVRINKAEAAGGK